MVTEVVIPNLVNNEIVDASIGSNGRVYALSLDSGKFRINSTKLGVKNALTLGVPLSLSVSGTIYVGLNTKAIKNGNVYKYYNLHVLDSRTHIVEFAVGVVVDVRVYTIDKHPDNILSADVWNDSGITSTVQYSGDMSRQVYSDIGGTSGMMYDSEVVGDQVVTALFGSVGHALNGKVSGTDYVGELTTGTYTGTGSSNLNYMNTHDLQGILGTKLNYRLYVRFDHISGQLVIDTLDNAFTTKVTKKIRADGTVVSGSESIVFPIDYKPVSDPIVYKAVGDKTYVDNVGNVLITWPDKIHKDYIMDNVIYWSDVVKVGGISTFRLIGNGVFNIARVLQYRSGFGSSDVWKSGITSVSGIKIDGVLISGLNGVECSVSDDVVELRIPVDYITPMPNYVYDGIDGQNLNIVG